MRSPVVVLRLSGTRSRTPSRGWLSRSTTARPMPDGTVQAFGCHNYVNDSLLVRVRVHVLVVVLVHIRRKPYRNFNGERKENDEG